MSVDEPFDLVKLVPNTSNIETLVYYYFKEFFSDRIIEYYKNLSDENNNKTLNGASTNLTLDQPKCELPLENPDYTYSAISPGEYNFYPRGGEYVEIFTILLIKCNYGFAGKTFDQNIDDVVVCENGTWSHKVECQGIFF